MLTRRPQRFDDEAITELKTRIPLSSVVSRQIALKPSGNELVGLCPFHDEATPSFHVNDAKGLYHCFGCSASGDIIGFTMASQRVGFVEALQWLGQPMPELAQPGAKTLKAAPKPTPVEAFADQWDNAKPIENTHAEIYLRSRGIVTFPSGALRFEWFRRKDARTGAYTAKRPALVVPIRDAAETVIGIQRVVLYGNGASTANRKNFKYILGKTSGCAAHFGPASHEVVLIEGPEDGLTWLQQHPGATVWTTLSAANFHTIRLPDTVTSVVLAGDNDGPGRAAVERALAAYASQGRRVRAVFPDPQFKDWNDALMDRRMGASAPLS